MSIKNWEEYIIQIQIVWLEVAQSLDPIIEDAEGINDADGISGVEVIKDVEKIK